MKSIMSCFSTCSINSFLCLYERINGTAVSADAASVHSSCFEVAEILLAGGSKRGALGGDGTGVGGILLLGHLGAEAQRLGGVVPYVDPLVLVTDAIRAVLVPFLGSADKNDMRFDFIVAGNGSTAVSPFAVDLDVLVKGNLGFATGILALA
jgi:hypothetical protein